MLSTLAFFHSALDRLSGLETESATGQTTTRSVGSMEATAASELVDVGGDQCMWYHSMWCGGQCSALGDDFRDRHLYLHGWIDGPGDQCKISTKYSGTDAT